MLEAKNIGDANDRQLYIDLRAQNDADLTDQLQGLDQDLTHERTLARAAEKRAVAKRQEQRTRTVKVERAQANERILANHVQAQINAQVAKSIKLAKTDKALSAQIALQEAQLAARLAAGRARDAAIASAARNSNIGGNGETSPIGSTGISPGGSSGNVSLSTVDGHLINSQIAAQAAAMINAARAQGVPLSINNAYRDPAEQIALREAHCGSSYYAIYQMSPSACHPPTARPGSSMHEVGLAIDFDSCNSHGTACWQWLAGHASSYGFYNLPSEPWHWSINGH
jgi:LAS superfamily LD-carboxypeptidase LdcB